MELTVTIILVSGFLITVVTIWTNVAAGKKRRKAEEHRRSYIYTKYGRTELAEQILNKIVWVGETSEQLRDSFGSPLDIDEKVLKTKKKEIWKYIHKGANRYGLRFTLENDVVVGWDEKL